MTEQFIIDVACSLSVVFGLGIGSIFWVKVL